MKILLLISLLTTAVSASAFAQEEQPAPFQGGFPSANAVSSPSQQPNPGFPDMAPTPEEQLRMAVNSSNSYGNNPANVPAQNLNGVAALPPLTPPNNVSFLMEMIAPFGADEIRKAKEMLNEQSKAVSHKPVVTVPRTRSVSVDLSPGAELPVLYTAAGEISTLVFIDASGAPWPIAASPRVSNVKAYHVEWLKDTPSLIVSSLSSHETGNLTVFLQGLATPVLVQLNHAKVKNHKQSVDYRVDLRIPGRGPNAAAPIFGADKIALYDNIMQKFLDGLPPEGATELAVGGGNASKAKVWDYQGKLFVRTPLHIQTAFDQSMSSSDGMKIYRLLPTPFITLSDMGTPVTLELKLN